MEKRRRAPGLIPIAVAVLLALVASSLLVGGPDDEARSRAASATERSSPAAPVVSVSATHLDAEQADDATRDPGTAVVEPREPLAPPSPASAGSPTRHALRPARGLVRDGVTGRPIANAWLTWRGGPDLYAKRLELPPSLTATTDADGRFELRRPVVGGMLGSLMHAGAEGYGWTVVRPGLQDQVVIDLLPMATLEVRHRLDVRLDGALVFVGPLGSIPPFGLGRWQREGGALVYEFTRLPAGPVRVELLGRTIASGALEPGERTVLELAADGYVKLTGTIEAGGHAVHGVTLRPVLPDVDPDARVNVMTPLGQFDVGLLPGRYRARVEVYTPDGEARIAWLPGTIDVAPSTRSLALRVPDANEPVEVILPAESASPVWLVAFDPAGEAVSLQEVGEGRFVGAAPAGRYAVFGDGFLGELTLPAGAPVVLEREVVPLRLRWRVPAELGEREALSVRAALFPAPFESYEVHYFATLEVGASVEGRAVRGDAHDLALPRAGAYVLVGETELGPFRAAVDVPIGGAEVVVDLTPR